MCLADRRVHAFESWAGMPDELLISTPDGLYCPPGDFYIDPWRPVARAVITHAHADHARPGCGHYLTASSGLAVLRTRLGPEANIQTEPYETALQLGEVRLSLHPAGHILGSAQVRLEHRGQVWVVSGDYKVQGDGTCTPFEPVRCEVFVTESTFGLPLYRWPSQQVVLEEINTWWRGNADQGKISVLFVYALGKAQRVLAGLDASIGPLLAHGAVMRLNAAYRAAGVALPTTHYAAGADQLPGRERALVLAPPSARATPWLRRFGNFSSGFASGWMQLRGARRRRAVDRGFVLSDHADWLGLQQAIRETGAARVLVTHGTVAPLVRWLRESGWQAAPLAAPFEGELDETSPAAGPLDTEDEDSSGLPAEEDSA